MWRNGTREDEICFSIRRIRRCIATIIPHLIDEMLQPNRIGLLLTTVATITLITPSQNNLLAPQRMVEGSGGAREDGANHPFFLILLQTDGQAGRCNFDRNATHRARPIRYLPFLSRLEIPNCLPRTEKASYPGVVRFPVRVVLDNREPGFLRISVFSRILSGQPFGSTPACRPWEELPSVPEIEVGLIIRINTRAQERERRCRIEILSDARFNGDTTCPIR
ncbi:hypothetical protein V8F33_012250 [Rhypophila sp. PSN 637]